MRLPTLAAVVTLSAIAFAKSAPPIEFDQTHAQWTEILAAHEKAGRFDYAKLKKDRRKLDHYLSSLEAVRLDELKSWSRDKRYAFWINAYNAYTISLVVDNYPLDSIKDLGGIFKSVWKKRFIPLGHLYEGDDDDELNLNEIEHSILRPQFEDARVHAAVNCASVSCPPLRNEAFVGAKLNPQLNDQVKKWLADPTRNQFEPAENRVRVSKIFDWFDDDFERDGGGSVIGWIRKYAPESQKKWLEGGKIKIKYMDYDWDLNQTKGNGRG